MFLKIPVFIRFQPGKRFAARGNSTRLRALVLLEVVLSLGILLLTISVVGAIFRNGRENVETSERLSRGMIQTERLIAEIDTNSGLLNLDENEQSGFFRDGETIELMSWKIKVEPLQRVEGLLQVDIDIFIGDPEADVGDRKFVMSTRFFRALPRGLDLEKDFGLEEEQINQLTDAIPGGAQVIDPNNFDPRMLASMDMDTLIELLPTLIAAFGDQFAGGQLDQIIAAIQSGDQGALQRLAGQAGGGQFGPGGNQGGGDQGGGGGQFGPGGGNQGGDQGGGGQGGGGQGGGQRPPRSNAGGRPPRDNGENQGENGDPNNPRGGGRQPRRGGRG